MSDIEGDVSPAEFVRGEWSGFHGPVRLFGDLLGVLGPRWSDSRAEGGIIPNREMEGARRRAASGQGAPARQLGKWPVWVIGLTYTYLLSHDVICAQCEQYYCPGMLST